MCLYPRLIRNPKYKANKKNGGIIPYAKDKRALYVAIGCGKCMECRRQKANEWRVRLNEEIKRNDNPCRFVTLTIKEDYLKSIEEIAGKDNVYGQATILVRRYLERIRKRTGKSVKHWIIPELGHKGTERLHLHGLIWCEEPRILKEEWANVCGHYFGGKDITAKTINYVSKYILKQDEKHTEFQGKIFCSAGIGQGYVGSMQYSKNEYRGSQTDETYRLPTGHKVALPIYYRNKRWTDSEREQLWMARLDRQIRYVDGLAVDMAIEEDKYWRLLDTAREKNERLHYGKIDGWEKARYINSCKKITKEAWINRNNDVILQNNHKENKYGTIKTNTGNCNENDVEQSQNGSSKARDIVYTTGGLFNCKNLHDREESIVRLWDEAKRHRNLDWGMPTRKTKNYEVRRNDTDFDNLINSKLSHARINNVGEKPENEHTTSSQSDHRGQYGNYMALHGKGNVRNEDKLRQFQGDIQRWAFPETRTNRQSSYEVVDVDTGEIIEKSKIKNYKTISYEKRSQKITRPDGSKAKIWHTIRFVQKVGYEQLDLFSGSNGLF